MLRFLRIERPTTTTERPTSTATSIACCMRWMFEANEEIRTRPWRAGMIWRKACPTIRSDWVKPARSALVESPSSRSTPRLPISASLPTSVRSPSTGVASSFQSPVWKIRPAAGLDADPDGVWHRVRHAHELEPEGPELERTVVGGVLAQVGGVHQAVLVEFDLTRPSVSRVANTARTRTSRSR